MKAQVQASSPSRGKAQAQVTGSSRGRSLNPGLALAGFLRDETGVTSLEYVLAALAVAFGAVGGSRLIAGALVGYLHRIYMVVTLPIP